MSLQSKDIKGETMLCIYLALLLSFCAIAKSQMSKNKQFVPLVFPRKYRQTVLSLSALIKQGLLQIILWGEVEKEMYYLSIRFLVHVNIKRIIQFYYFTVHFTILCLTPRHCNLSFMLFDALASLFVEWRGQEAADQRSFSLPRHDREEGRPPDVVLYYIISGSKSKIRNPVEKDKALINSVPVMHRLCVDLQSFVLNLTKSTPDDLWIRLFFSTTEVTMGTTR